MTDKTDGTADMRHKPITVFPPRYEHEEYDENLYEWTERGVEHPHEFDWSPVFYTCKFCPARANDPEDVEHSAACPVSKERGA